MFETGAWDDDPSGAPAVSALSWAVAQSQHKHDKSDNPEQRDKSDPTNKKSKKLKTKAKRLAISVENEYDKYVNSPSATKKLIDTDDDDETDEVFSKKKKKKKAAKLVNKLKSSATSVSDAVSDAVTDATKKIGRSLSDSSIRDPGYLLKLGEKFSSETAFLRFIGLPGKKKGVKRSHDDSVDTNSKSESGDVEANLSGLSSDNDKENDEAPIAPPRKKAKGSSLNIDKIRDMLKTEDTGSSGASKTAKTIHKTLADEARDKLTASRFRYLNEQLYTQPSNAAVKLFSSDSTLFSAYHQVKR